VKNDIKEMNVRALSLLNTSTQDLFFGQTFTFCDSIQVWPQREPQSEYSSFWSQIIGFGVVGVLSGQSINGTQFPNSSLK
jgi:hypothetical protein